LIHQQARLDALLADHAAGKHVSDYAISAIREEITKQKHFLAKREVRRQAEREAFRRLPEEQRERILAQPRRQEVESASEWAAFHAQQSAEGESVMDREYEQAKSYLERIDAPLRWLPWILLVCAPIASSWGQNYKVLGVLGLLVPWIGAAWFLVRVNVLPRTFQRYGFGNAFVAYLAASLAWGVIALTTRIEVVAAFAVWGLGAVAFVGHVIWIENRGRFRSSLRTEPMDLS